MNPFDIFYMGLRNLWRRKVRTFLTVLGVVIGTASIVVMVSIGIGMDENFKQQLEQMGSLNIIEVNNYGDWYDDMGGGMVVGGTGQGKKPVLDDKTVTLISKIKGVEGVLPMLSTYVKLVSNKYVSYARIIGTEVDMLEKFDFRMDEGRLIRREDVNAIIVGKYVPYDFYNPKVRSDYYGYRGGDEKPPIDIMNDRLELTFDMDYGERNQGGLGGGDNGQQNKRPSKLYKINCMGIIEESQDEKDYSIYMDITQLKKLVQDNNRHERNTGGSGSMGRDPHGSGQDQGYEEVKVRVADIDRVEEVQDKIKEMGFGTYSLADLRKSMQEYSRKIQTVLGSIGGISLFVAFLGITNTMVMSIYERTREIGVMKVLGCELGDIRGMFLFEAAIIGMLGGILGVGLSYGVSFILNRFAGGGAETFMPVSGESRISVIPPWLAIASIIFATIIGLMSGLYPARRAMKLSALDAIRTE